jgi:hypothetical protein
VEKPSKEAQDWWDSLDFKQKILEDHNHGTIAAAYRAHQSKEFAKAVKPSPSAKVRELVEAVKSLLSCIKDGEARYRGNFDPCEMVVKHDDDEVRRVAAAIAAVDGE